MPSDFTLRYSEDIRAFHARFTREADGLGVQQFVAITAGDQRKLFKAKISKVASGTAVFVAPDTFNLSEHQTVQVEGVSKQQYRFYRIRHDKSWVLATVGLIASAISALITASLAVGKIQPILFVSAGLLSLATWSALILQVAGAAFLYSKGLLESE